MLQRRRWITSVATLVVLALIGACTNSPPDPKESESGPESGSTVSTAVDADQDTTAEIAGIQVVLPPGAVEDGTTLELSTSTDEQPDLPEYLNEVGPALSLSLSNDAQLSQAATLRFPIPDEGTYEQYVVAWQDEPNAEWRWLPTEVVDGVAVAQTDHFSSGLLAGVDIPGWVEDRKTALANYFTGRAGIANPTCGDEDDDGGIKVTSDSGDRVKWCFGTDGGRRVLKVANNTRTYLQISYPKAWPLIDGASITASADTFARAVGMTAAVPRGMASRIVDGGDTLTIEVPDSSSGNVHAEMSTLAWLARAAILGGETFTLVAKAASKALGQAAKGSADRFAAFLGGDTEALDAWDELGECTEGILEGVDLDPEVAKAVAGVVWSCLPGVMATQIKDVEVWAAGVIIKMIVTLVDAVLTAVNLLITSMREVWDTVASFGGPDDTLYDIRLQAPVDPLTQVSLDTGWNGVTPGDDINAVADQLDTPTYSNCPPAAMIASQSNWPVIVSSDGTSIDFVEVFDNTDSIPDGFTGMDVLTGPDGIHVGDLISQYPNITSGSDVVETYPGDKTNLFDAYWVSTTSHPWYFYVRADAVTGKVRSYGLARDQSTASDRGHTQGGCY